MQLYCRNRVKQRGKYRREKVRGWTKKRDNKYGNSDERAVRKERGGEKNVPAGLLGGCGIWRSGLDIVRDSSALDNAGNGEGGKDDSGELHGGLCEER